MYLSTVQPSYVGGEICESVFALRHRIDHGSVVVFLLSWPPLKKWWRTMVLASSKTVTAKIAMNKNFTNPSRRGLFSSESTLFRFVVMSCSPVDQSAKPWTVGKPGCRLFLQVWTCLDDERCSIFCLSRTCETQVNWRNHKRALA